MKPKSIPGVPDQEKGSFHDTESYREFSHSGLALSNYQILKNRFLDINHWKKYCNQKSADFKLCDASGKIIDRAPAVGDLIRINIPGPGIPESGGFEWTLITYLGDRCIVSEETESMTICCVPTTVPNQKENRHISHFYATGAVSVFRISRGETFVKIGIYGRNETPNFNTTLLGKMRNILIAIGGMFGMSKIQWKVFADEILKF